MANTTFVNNATPIVADWLNDVNDAVYQQTSGISGATARALSSKLGDWVSVKDYGAVGDGVTNDAAAFQAAHDTGKTVIIPEATYAVNTAIISNFVPRFIGMGSNKSNITTTVSSGNFFEFNNASSSYDEGLILEGFSVTGPGSGGAVGLKIEGAVYVNSIMRDLLIKNMGSHGVYIDDCLTMVLERVRAQTNGGIGILVDQSNAISLISCSAESNGSHGIYFNDGGAAFGENFGASVIGCHSEANGTSAVSHALYIKNHYGVSVLGGWFQCESTVAANASSAIELDGAQHCRIVGALLNTGGTVTNLKGVGLTGAIFNDVNVYCYGFASGRDIVADASSGRNRVAGTSSVGSQGVLSFTDSSATGNVYEGWCGSGGNYGYEHYAPMHSFKTVGGTEVLRVVSGGVQLRNHTTGTTAPSAGGAGALPATPLGYLTININGTNRQMPYY
jgi:hypothetical protein